MRKKNLAIVVCAMLAVGIISCVGPQNQGEKAEISKERIPRHELRIVFLVDASGSAMDVLPFMQEDLRKTIEYRLRDDKSFNVLVFSGKEFNKGIGSADGMAQLFAGLEPANWANCKKAVSWVQRIEAGGSGDPLTAIQKALEMDPDQIHLISSNITGTGIHEMSQDRFMAEAVKAYRKAVEKRKADGSSFRIAFKTYQFAHRDPLEAIGKKPTLIRLIEETGGVPARDYRFVTPRELGLP